MSGPRSGLVICKVLAGVFLVGLLAGADAPPGCNPDFWVSLTGEGPTGFEFAAPGWSTNTVLVRVVNKATDVNTTAFADVRYRDPTSPAGPVVQVPLFGGITQGTSGIPTGGDLGQTVPCTATLVGLGTLLPNDASNPVVVGAGNVRRAAGLDQSPMVLQNGVEFRCGDTITFVIYQSGNDFRVGWQVIAGGKGSTTGVFGAFVKEKTAYDTWRAQNQF